MRTLAVLNILCALAISCQSHDLVVGHATTPDDVMVFATGKDAFGAPFAVRTSVIEYPPPGLEVVKANITAVYVKDNHINRTEGYPSIIEGGLGHNFVKIKLESRVDEGFSFDIRVYGRI